MTTRRAAHLIDHPSEFLVQNLASRVEGALWSFDPIRQTNTLIDIEVDGGVVTLAGNIRSDMMRSIASQLARNVPGVTRVQNELVSDSRLESDVAIALAMAPDLEMCTDRISVKSLLGTVYLEGIVADEELDRAQEMVQRAEELVREVSGVHDVRNELIAVEGTGDNVYAAEVVEEEEEEEEVVGARAMGSLLSEEKRDKVRRWIAERRAAREAAAE